MHKIDDAFIFNHSLKRHEEKLIIIFCIEMFLLFYTTGKQQNLLKFCKCAVRNKKKKREKYNMLSKRKPVLVIRNN